MNAKLNVFVVLFLTWAILPASAQETRRQRIEDYANAVGDQVKRFDTEAAAIQKKADEEIHARRAKLIEDLETLARSAAKEDLVEAFHGIQARIKELKLAQAGNSKPTAAATPAPAIANQPNSPNAAATAREPLPTPAKHPIEVMAIDLGRGVKMEFIRIHAGQFLMGSPDSDKDADAYEKPQHRVKITHDYYLSKNLTTQEQYMAVLNQNPSHFRFGGGGVGPGVDTRHFPVEMVTWDGAADFCAELTRRDKQGRTFCLPTEAQWEYAARAGAATRYSFGDQTTDLRGHAWYMENSNRTPHPVGTSKPNSWGLYDMHGNVWEWCADRWGQEYNKAGVEDPTGPDGGRAHVVRGGSYRSPALALRSANRHGRFGTEEFTGNRILIDQPAYRDLDLGFRVAIQLAKSSALKTDR